VPLYTEVGVGSDGLLALYRSLIDAIPAALLTELGEMVKEKSAREPRSSGARDLRQALKLLTSEDSISRSLAFEWLQARHSTPHLRTLKAFGISERVENDARAIEIIAELIASIREARSEAAVVWLIDEFQRIADVPPRKRDAFAKSIVSLFNVCPVGLHFVLSFSVAQQATALALLPPDLRSRASSFPMLTLPHLGKQECIEFARDLFDAFRATPRLDRDYPFSQDSLAAIVDQLEQDSSGAVTPRLLMEQLESVLFEVYDVLGERLQLPLRREAVSEALSSIAARHTGDA
jgi:hypothetical protein